jgi:hypothetical protein
MVSFILMVNKATGASAQVTEPLPQVLSSIIAAWSDISIGLETLQSSWPDTLGTIGTSVSVSNVLSKHIGYLWMFANCLTTAAYVSIVATSCQPSHHCSGLIHAKANKADWFQGLGYNVL